MESNRSTEDAGSVDPLEPRSEGLAALVGEKRPAENGEDGGLGIPSPKKARISGGLVGNVKKVAEIVLVLAAMGKMRGGRNPTTAEMEMMVEARDTLATVCEEFAPKEVFPRDLFGAIIEDLGLSKLREQKLGFRPPKMSIAEKLLFTKQKMEKSEEFSLRSATHSSQRLQTKSGAAAESRGASHTTRMFPSDKTSHASISSGSFQPASPLGQVSVANSMSLPYQLPASEIRTPGLPSRLLGRDSSSSALPRVERPHFRLDGRSNGPSYTSHVQAKTHTWSQQSQPASSGKTGQDNKVQPVEGTVKLEGTADVNTSKMTPQAATSKPLINQSTSVHLQTIHLQSGMNFVQAPLLSNAHIEIGKIIQKLLQPQLPEHPTWTPPSRDYMSKALTCQVCKLTINEVENVLVCDACDKGYHMKCLQSHSQKGIPRGEWHCLKCLSLSNGKPLPPKYGRVTRNINTSKMLSNAATNQLSPEKKVGIGEKGNQQKITENGSSGLQSAPADSTSNNPNHSSYGSNMSNAREIQGTVTLSSREKMDNKRHFETCPDDIIRTSGPAGVSSVASSSVERSCEEKLVSELKGQSPAKPSEILTKTSHLLQTSSNPQENDQKGLLCGAGVPSKQYFDKHLTVKESEKSNGSKTFDGNPNDAIREKEQVAARPEPVETSGTDIMASDHASASSDGRNDFDWIGDILEVVDEKTYYSSCCINGVVYKLQDYALFHSNNGKLTPSKLQAMWEDNKTRSKWVIVNRCYFPDDLPKTVGRPCSPESNEVYESNHGSAIMFGLIRGPCEVLPPGKFFEESARRTRWGSEANDGSRPLFVCKWFYDESKGVFRDVSS